MKKFSKKLFCLMLVAIMVATAIPFGAFADPITVEGPFTVVAKCNGTEVGRGHIAQLSGYDHGVPQHRQNALDYGNMVWTNNCYKASTTEASTLDGQTLTVKVELDTEKHPANPTNECHVWAIDHFDATKHYEKCTVVGCSATKEEPHSDTEKNATASTPYVAPTCGAAGKNAKTVYNCGYTEGGQEIPATDAHNYGADNICTGCGQVKPGSTPAQVDFTVMVTTGGATEIVHGTKKMTQEEAKALSTNAAGAKTILNAMKDVNSKFGTCADAIDADATVFSSMVVNPTSNTITVNLTKDPTVTTPSSSDSFEVTFQIDNGTPYTRTVTKGDWYFNASLAGNANGWGNKQVWLYVTDNNGNVRRAEWNSKDDAAYAKKGDVSVRVKSQIKTVKIVYLKNETCSVKESNGTTIEYEWGETLGKLPALPDGYGYWYIGKVQLTSDTVYKWEEDKVYARPMLATTVNNGKVHLFVYNSKNELMKDFDVTDKVQSSNGLLFLDDLKSIIKSQTGVSSVSAEGLMDETGWAYYLNNKNSYKYAYSNVDVGTADERAGVQNVYVVLKNVSSGSNADTSNPKTGDTAMIGTAAIVMALAAVGMGTAFYMKKKELF